MAFPNDPPHTPDLDRAADTAERRIRELLVFANAHAATGLSERARQTRMLAVLRQDELSRRRALHPARRT